MRALLNYIIILAIGIAIGYQFSSAPKVITKVQAGNDIVSKTNTLLDRVLSSEDRKIDSKNVELKLKDFQKGELEPEIDALSIHELSKVIDRKQERLREKFINPLKREGEEKEAAKDGLFQAIVPLAEQSSYWHTKNEIQIGDDVLVAEWIMHFYSSKEYGKGFSVSNLSKKEDLCWMVSTDFEYKGARTTGGTSNCLDPVQKDNSYFIEYSTYYSVSISAYLNFILIPLPNSGNSFEVLKVGESEWQKIPTNEWTPITSEAAEQIFKRRSEE